MIANFFQSLERHGVEYLLISGQAAVLYGAATFSEDIDLWINPTEKNRDRFLLALHDAGARYYKLTPPLTVGNLERGHGFHFVLPGEKENEVFLDVMGSPPRTGSFTAAAATAQRIETEWGAIPTIGIKELVELKKTQRLEDYPVIGKLALTWLGLPECKTPADDLLWALQNIFTLPELTELFVSHAAAVDIAMKFNRDVGQFGRQVAATDEIESGVERDVGNFFQKRMSELQGADRDYWREIIRELKQFRAAGKLMLEGESVSAPF